MSPVGKCSTWTKSVLMSVVPLAILFMAAGCASAKGEYAIQTKGGEYQLRVLTEPRPNRVHILRVDLAAGKAEVAVVVAADPDGGEPDEAMLTSPLKLADSQGVLAFVNANPWDSLPGADGKRNRNWYEGQPVHIIGLAVSGGRVRSRASLRAPGVVWVDHGGGVRMGNIPPGDDAVEAVAGWGQIVTNGQVIPGLVRDGTAVPPKGVLNPMTAIGVDQSGGTLWLVVVDGRQRNYSEGMTQYEFACLLRDLGCWNAGFMDGGGSSIMGLAGTDGRLRVVNSPSDRPLGLFQNVRPLPVVLTIREKSE